MILLLLHEWTKRSFYWTCRHSSKPSFSVLIYCAGQLDLLQQGPVGHHLTTKRNKMLYNISLKCFCSAFIFLACRRAVKKPWDTIETKTQSSQHRETKKWIWHENSNYACAEVLSCNRLGFPIRPKAQHGRACVLCFSPRCHVCGQLCWMKAAVAAQLACRAARVMVRFGVWMAHTCDRCLLYPGVSIERAKCWMARRAAGLTRLRANAGPVRTLGRPVSHTLIIVHLVAQGWKRCPPV